MIQELEAGKQMDCECPCERLLLAIQYPMYMHIYNYIVIFRCLFEFFPVFSLSRL